MVKITVVAWEMNGEPLPIPFGTSRSHRNGYRTPR